VLDHLNSQTGSNFAATEAEQATIKVYEEYAGALLRYAGQLAASHDEARDAVQEVLLRYFVERRFGRKIENPRAWLYHVLRNYLLDQIKAAPNRREVQAGNVDALILENHENPENLLQRSQMAREIAQVLSGREFTCLTLRGEGLSYSEIAQVMDIRIGTVGATLSRAQEKLRRYGSLDKKNSFRGLAEALLCLVQEALNYSTS
jgi:RNA polymerase sigma-70 factor (ECF subfamily)